MRSTSTATFRVYCPLDTLEQEILAVALNERLDEVYRAARIPMPTTRADAGNDVLRRLVEDLLEGRSPPARTREQSD